MNLRVFMLAMIAGIAVIPLSYADDIPADSLYQAQPMLTTQRGTAARFDLYRGHPLMISMFYGSCPDVCPLLIVGMQNYENSLDAAARKNLRVLLVSFDATRDTPDKLQAIATMHRADTKRWTFATANELDTRKIAALLGIQYRHQANGSFDHSLLITLLDADGRIVATTTKLTNDAHFVAALRATHSKPAKH